MAASLPSVVGMTTTPHHEVLPGAPAAAPTALPWRQLAVLSFAAFWTVTLEMLPAGLLPQISRDLEVRPARFGLLVTVWAVTVGLSSLPLTRLTRSWQRPTALAAIAPANPATKDVQPVRNAASRPYAARR